MYINSQNMKLWYCFTKKWWEFKVRQHQKSRMATREAFGDENGQLHKIFMHWECVPKTVHMCKPFDDMHAWYTFWLCGGCLDLDNFFFLVLIYSYPMRFSGFFTKYITKWMSNIKNANSWTMEEAHILSNLYSLNGLKKFFHTFLISSTVIEAIYTEETFALFDTWISFQSINIHVSEFNSH